MTKTIHKSSSDTLKKTKKNSSLKQQTKTKGTNQRNEQEVASSGFALGFCCNSYSQANNCDVSTCTFTVCLVYLLLHVVVFSKIFEAHAN